MSWYKRDIKEVADGKYMVTYYFRDGRTMSTPTTLEQWQKTIDKEDHIAELYKEGGPISHGRIIFLDCDMYDGVSNIVFAVSKETKISYILRDLINEKQKST